MNRQAFFHHAAWVGASQRTAETFSVLQGTFMLQKPKKAFLNVLGLGFFKCFINGKCINPDTFLPLSSDYEAGVDPEGEVLSAHRVYVPRFDVSSFIQDGENVIEIEFGGGWYTFIRRCFGLPKVIFYLEEETAEGTVSFGSGTHCRIRKGRVCGYFFTKFEEQDLCAPSEWEAAVLTEEPVTDYCATDCPADALIETLPVTEPAAGVYDCGQNTTGYPVLKLHAPKGEKVEVLFSEELLADGTLDLTHHHSQRFSVISDGTEREVQPEFTWFGFRGFQVIGNATPTVVKVVHTPLTVTGSFECDKPALNWAYKTFLHTMLCNLHTGHPSDCPHLERRGYTGDGQLTTHAVLSTLDARALYEKWLQDIADGQDLVSGHVQYTAPYIHSGGGPGGWGCAIVEVPWQLYRHYGNKEILEKYYGNMRRYIDYLEAHSEFGLVTSDKEGDWCLGDWCGPNILYPSLDITSHNQQVILPAPMVNTYFMVKSLDRMVEIATLLGHTEHAEEYREKIKTRKAAIRAAYLNTFDGNFIMNVQGANAFAVDLGMIHTASRNDNTLQNMVRYYQRLGHFDTGIFATDVLTRVLFEHGEGALAVALLEGNGDQGYEHWRQNGATTYHEYWDSNRSRSHNHPMFGGPVAYFFEFLLGIRQPKGAAGYRKLVIDPQATECFGFMRGSMQTPQGTVAVSYRKNGETTEFSVTIPPETEAVFSFGGAEYPLQQGENKFQF